MGIRRDMAITVRLLRMAMDILMVLRRGTTLIHLRANNLLQDTTALNTPHPTTAITDTDHRQVTPNGATIRVTADPLQDRGPPTTPTRVPMAARLLHGNNNTTTSNNNTEASPDIPKILTRKATTRLTRTTRRIRRVTVRRRRDPAPLLPIPAADEERPTAVEGDRRRRARNNNNNTLTAAGVTTPDPPLPPRRT